LGKVFGEKTLQLIGRQNRRTHSALPAGTFCPYVLCPPVQRFEPMHQEATRVTVLPARPPIADAPPSVLREDLGDVAVLTLNRPEARNSLSLAMLAALSETFSAIAGDRRLRAVVIAANGPAFCAGHDLKEVTARRADPDRGRAFFTEIMRACAGV